jgi:hypothetical protein
MKKSHRHNIQNTLVKTTFSKTQDCFGNIRSWPSRFDPSRYTHCHVYACHMIKLLSSFYFDELPFVVGLVDLSGVTVFRDLRHRAWYTQDTRPVDQHDDDPMVSMVSLYLGFLGSDYHNARCFGSKCHQQIHTLQYMF